MQECFYVDDQFYRQHQFELPLNYATQGGETIASRLMQAEAFRIGEREARHDRVYLVVQERDGRIRSKNSYGTESRPPQDREHC